MTKLVCSVSTCMHHEDNYCCKNSINVDGKNAHECEGTCCASFDKKDKDTFSNSCCETPHENQEISCDAQNCMYNESRLCKASKVGIAGNGAKQPTQTECATFKMRG